MWAALLLPMAGLAQSPGQAPVGELYASDTGAAQPVSTGGMSVVTGSELSAGVAAARLRLYRGGQVRICPRSSLSVTSSNTAGLMFAMGTGTLELDYRLNQRVADLLITPDFSVNFIGPGAFHVALGVNKKGDTCVKPLPGNTAEISVSELLGAAIYKVKANESVVFQGGKVTVRGELKEECGCPQGPPTMLVAGQAPPQTLPQNPVKVPPPTSSTMPGSATLPPERPGQVHVEVETPFVFSARGSAKPYSVAKIRFSTLPNNYFLPDKVDPVVQGSAAPTPVTNAKVESAPETSAEKKEKKGFFGKIGSFFRSLVHR